MARIRPLPGFRGARASDLRNPWRARATACVRSCVVCHAPLQPSNTLEPHGEAWGTRGPQHPIRRSLKVAGARTARPCGGPLLPCPTQGGHRCRPRLPGKGRAPTPQPAYLPGPWASDAQARNHRLTCQVAGPATYVRRAAEIRHHQQAGRAIITAVDVGGRDRHGQVVQDDVAVALEAPRAARQPRAAAQRHADARQSGPPAGANGRAGAGASRSGPHTPRR